MAMKLSTAQKATLKAWIDANASALSDGAAAALANTATSYQVWQTKADKSLVDAAVTKANFTPADTPPASTNTVTGTNDALLFQNRAMACQLKQMNAQWTLSGPGTTLDARSSNLRQTLQDCLRAIPSGASGASQDAGWGTAASPNAVRLALMRGATNAEKLFVAVATGPGNDGVALNRGSTTNPDLLGTSGVDASTLEGAVTEADVTALRAS